jgi:hypothetical protein
LGFVAWLGPQPSALVRSLSEQPGRRQMARAL